LDPSSDPVGDGWFRKLLGAVHHPLLDLQGDQVNGGSPLPNAPPNRSRFGAGRAAVVELSQRPRRAMELRKPLDALARAH
jgi:hypothetical protein